MKKKPKVLVSAYACEPGKGSEPGVGWNWVKQISKFAEVWVITRTNNRSSIEEALKKEPLENVHWIYYDLPYWLRFWKKGQRGVYFYYFLWQKKIYFLAKQLDQQVKFNIIHHVTFVNYWLPSFLSFLAVPFIFGPVGGGEDTPPEFFATFSFKGKIYEYKRILARKIFELTPYTRKNIKNASIILATTKETAKKIKNLGAKKVQILSQVALSNEEIKFLSKFPLKVQKNFRFISIGRLLHWKGFHLGIKAFAKFIKKFPQSEYWIIGDGPERKNLEKLAAQLGIKNKVKFWGFLPRNEALKKLAETNVLVHPSLHDSGGWVSIEAMAAGRPVICLDLGGPALQVTSETGFKIPARTPEQVVNDIANAMYLLATNKNLYRQMSLAARERVKKYFTWERRGEEIKRIYAEILKNT